MRMRNECEKYKTDYVRSAKVVRWVVGEFCRILDDFGVFF